MKSIEYKVGKLHITVNYKTELLGIIQIISNYQDTYPFLLEKYANKEYIEKVELKFNKYKDYKVVKLFDDFVVKHEFSFDAPFALFLQLRDDLSIERLDSYVFEDRLNCDNEIYKFIELLPKFAEEINFCDYYKSNEQLYRIFINNIKNQLGTYDLVDYMEKYYGIVLDKNLVINLMPFQSNGNYGITCNNSIYSCIGCSKSFKTEKDIYKSSGYGLLLLLFHEFSHSIVNPITAKNKLIEDGNNIFDDIKQTMSDMAYSDVDSIINEHIIRALTARFIFNMGHHEYYNDFLSHEESNGFIYIKPIANSLIEYENNRDKYKNISDFYPIIIETIKNGFNKKEETCYCKLEQICLKGQENLN